LHVLVEELYLTYYINVLTSAEDE